MEKRVLSHLGDKVNEVNPRIFVCERCAERRVRIHGALCHECINKSETFWFKRLAVRFGRIGWIVIIAIAVHFIITRIAG